MAYDPKKKTEAQKAAFYGAIEMPKRPRVRKYGGKGDVMKREVQIILDDQQLLDDLNNDDPLDPMSMNEFNDLMR